MQILQTPDNMMSLPDLMLQISDNDYQQMAIDQLLSTIGLDSHIANQVGHHPRVQYFFLLYILLYYLFYYVIVSFFWYVDMAFWTTWLNGYFYLSYPIYILYFFFDSNGAMGVLKDAAGKTPD